MSDYTAADIIGLDDLASIQHSPARFLGVCEDPWYAVLELIDNAVDEYQAGHCDEICIGYQTNNDTYLVADTGRGIPVEMNKKYAIPTVQAVFTKKDIGAKFGKAGQKAYAGSSVVGTHGVGSTATNALAKVFRVWTWRPGKERPINFYQGFRDGGKLENEKPLTGKSMPRPRPIKPLKKGTQIVFVPDPKYFGVTSVDPSRFTQLARELSCLCAGLTVHTVIDGKRTTYRSDDGLAGLVRDSQERADATATLGPLRFQFEFDANSRSQGRGTAHCEVVLSWASKGGELVSFANNKRTPYHGVHVAGFEAAVMEALQRYAGKNKFEFRDLTPGMYATVALKHPNPKYTSQIKSRVVSPGSIRKRIKEHLTPLLVAEIAKSQDVFELLIERAAKLCAMRARTALEAQKVSESMVLSNRLPEKLIRVLGRKRDHVELFILEGDSASGTARQARDRLVHEILPIRGKFHNVYQRDFQAVFGTKGNGKKATIAADIAAAVGCGIAGDCDPSKARVGRVVVCTDADDDGWHISALIIGLFCQYMRPVIEAGMLGILRSPLYRVMLGKKATFAYDDKHLREMVKGRRKGSFSISYLKGHGEANVDVFRRYAFSEDRIIDVISVERAEAIVNVETFLGEDRSVRRGMLDLGIHPPVRYSTDHLG